MPIFTEVSVESILCELKGKIEKSRGVVNCMQQGRVSFEDWVQIELCTIMLDKYVEHESYKIVAEATISTEDQRSVDIRICDANNNEDIKVVIEVKIIMIPNKNSLLDDIEKLNDVYKNTQKAVLCVAYRIPEERKNWDENYLNAIEELIGTRSEVKKQKEFKLRDTSIGEIEVTLYLNQWC